MTDIPEDVMKLAAKVVDDAEAECRKERYLFGFPTAHGKETLDKHIAAAILTDRAAQAERMARLEEALKPVLQSAGDGIANVFEQMLLGKWRDDHGHDVRMNVHMLNLRDVLMLIAKFREDHLDYTAVTSARALSQEGSEPS